VSRYQRRSTELNCTYIRRQSSGSRRQAPTRTSGGMPRGTPMLWVDDTNGGYMPILSIRVRMFRPPSYPMSRTGLSGRCLLGGRCDFASPLDRLTLFNKTIGTKKHNTNIIGLQVHTHPLYARFKFNKFFSLNVCLSNHGREQFHHRQTRHGQTQQG
jgi:hypothetical protein